MQRKHWIITATVAFGLLASAAAWAGWGKRGPERIKSYIDWRVDDLLDDIDADDAQRAQIDGLVDELWTAGQGVMSSRTEVRAAFLEAWSAEKPDAKKVHQMVDDRIDEFRALAHQAVDAGMKAHGVLDAKQRAEIAEMIRKHRHPHH